MAIITRTLGFQPGLQRLVWSGANNTFATLYLWGGGGGGGGRDSFGSLGGSGAGADYSQIDFLLHTGDVVDIAVGGGGTTPTGFGDASGIAGASYVADSQFTFCTRQSPASPPAIAQTNPYWCAFLNTYGIWFEDGRRVFDETYAVNFAASGSYTIEGSCDNYGTVFIDDMPVLSMPDFRQSYVKTGTISAGIHQVRIVATNTGGPAGVGVTISGANSFSGGSGGKTAVNISNNGASAGGGGGGGGATVAFLNSTLVAVAAGGGGGGGAGNGAGQNSPGPQGTATYPNSAGSNGTSRLYTFGGGGGGGGGGYNGGNGGNYNVNNTPGVAGSSGTSLGGAIIPGSGTLPGGRNISTYRGAVAYGGTPGNSGIAGAAVIQFNVTSSALKNQGTWYQIRKTWVKQQNIWVPVKATWVHDNGQWRQIADSSAPDFSVLTNTNFGVSSRPGNPPDDSASASGPINNVDNFNI